MIVGRIERASAAHAAPQQSCSQPYLLLRVGSAVCSIDATDKPTIRVTSTVTDSELDVAIQYTRDAVSSQEETIGCRDDIAGFRQICRLPLRFACSAADRHMRFVRDAIITARHSRSWCGSRVSTLKLRPGHAAQRAAMRRPRDRTAECHAGYRRHQSRGCDITAFLHLR